MLNFTITTVSIGGQRRNKIVSAATETRFKNILKDARDQGLQFGFGVLSINGKAVPPKMLTGLLNGRVTKGLTITFEQRQRPIRSMPIEDPNVFDLDSL